MDAMDFSILSLAANVRLTKGRFDLKAIHGHLELKSTYRNRSTTHQVVTALAGYPSLTFFIYRAGRIVCVGGRTHEEVERGLRALWGVVAPFYEDA